MPYLTVSEDKSLRLCHLISLISHEDPMVDGITMTGVCGENRTAYLDPGTLRTLVPFLGSIPVHRSLLLKVVLPQISTLQSKPCVDL